MSKCIGKKEIGKLIIEKKSGCLPLVQILSSIVADDPNWSFKQYIQIN